MKTKNTSKAEDHAELEELAELAIGRCQSVADRVLPLSVGRNLAHRNASRQERGKHTVETPRPERLMAA